MKRLSLIFFLAVPILLFGQKEELNRELTYGFHFSTIGGVLGGFDIRKAWLYDEDKLFTMSFSLAEIKHPKEKAYQFQGFRAFKAGKSNNFYVLRTTLASEITLFRKYYEDGVKLNLIYGAGLNLGFLKPYHVEVIESIGSTNGFSFVQESTIEQYDPNKHNVNLAAPGTGDVISGNFFFKGWDDIKVRPGINAKIAMSFEFGQFNRSISGLEIGLLADLFTEKMVIIPEAQNRVFFTSGFVQLFYGVRKYKAPKF